MPELAGRGRRDPTDYYCGTEPLAEACARAATRFMPAPRTILEPGCGTGNFQAAIPRAFPEATVLGIEIHPGLADYSRRRGLSVQQRDLLRGTWAGTTPSWATRPLGTRTSWSRSSTRASTPAA